MKHLNYQKGISPIIAVIIFAIILVGGGAYYFKQQAKPVSKSNVFTDQLTPEKFTQNFYNEYLTGGNPNSLIKEKLSDDLLKEVTASSSGPGYDHVLCAQDTPQSIGAVDKISATSDSASVLVHTIFRVSGDLPIKVELKSTNGTWKITKINCSPSSSEITSNWKTYTISKNSYIDFNFSFKYPADLHVENALGKRPNNNNQLNWGRVSLITTESRYILSVDFYDSIATLRDTYMDIAKNENIKTLDEIYANESYKNIGTEDIGGIKLNKYFQPKNSTNIIYAAQINSHIIEIPTSSLIRNSDGTIIIDTNLILNGQATDKLDDINQQIISTFKFLK